MVKYSRNYLYFQCYNSSRACVSILELFIVKSRNNWVQHKRIILMIQNVKCFDALMVRFDSAMIVLLVSSSPCVIASFLDKLAFTIKHVLKSFLRIHSKCLWGFVYISPQYLGYIIRDDYGWLKYIYDKRIWFLSTIGWKYEWYIGNIGCQYTTILLLRSDL